MSLQTRSQRMAQAAFDRVDARKRQGSFRDYVIFARRFPALLHSCGLAQAVAFARAKEQNAYLSDLVGVLRVAGHGEIGSGEQLDKRARDAAVGEYFRLTRDALRAAEWLKRYAEALSEEES